MVACKETTLASNSKSKSLSGSKVKYSITSFDYHHTPQTIRDKAKALKKS